MQVFNEYNARFLRGEWRIWRGLSRNPLFAAISIGTMFFQVIMVQLAAPVLTHALKIHPQGLSAKQWAICLGFGMATLVVQQILNNSRRLIVFLVHGGKQEEGSGVEKLPWTGP
mmetsp:Transcript_43055/g.109255  ORF Transcript_43055/g.109255 Transcript_43055/m.109255 type:complete len:114 (-) Transcript_43055:191-532(-)